MIKEIKKKAVYIDKHSFAKSVEVYSNKLTAMQNIKKEVKKHISNAHIDDKFYKDVMKNFFEMLLAKYKKQNTLNLRGEKLADLLEIDLSNLKKFSAMYDKLKGVQSPTEDSFTTYAETDEELSKLDATEKLVNMIKEINEVCGIRAYPFEVCSGFKNIIQYDIRTDEYKPNWRWIKNLKY